MSLFNFDELSLMSFFAVLVRFSVLFAVLPFIGDKVVPVPVKILLALAVSVALFPALIASGEVHTMDAARWASTPSGIAGTISLEVIVALLLGFTARMAFEAVSFGANLVGNFMGFAAASTFDPHQESQTQVVAQLQTTIAMLLFLAVDGHHMMLRAALDSFRIVGIGGAGLLASKAVSGALSQRLIEISSEVIKFGILIASPIAISLFAVNVAFGVMAKAMPQLNILVLSFAVSAFVGIFVLFLSIPEFQGVLESLFSRMGDWIEQVLLAVGH